MLFLMLLLLTTQASATPDPPPPVCSQPRVLDAVRERLSRAGQPVVLEEGSVGQVPGARADVVYCAVRVHNAVYDTPRFGPAPVDAVRVYQYALELRRNGIFLLP